MLRSFLPSLFDRLATLGLPSLGLVAPFALFGAERMPRASSAALAAPLPSPARRPGGALALWDDRDNRLDAMLFAANVPTFVLGADHRFLDWNPAFELVFGALSGMRIGAPLTAWYPHLDNFKTLVKKPGPAPADGEEPLGGKERISFVSPMFGRMTFTRIATPVVDRGSARIVGWLVVLNVNSVGKRAPFFERLHATVAHEGQSARLAAAHDLLLARARPLAAAHERVVALVDARSRLLEIGCGTGLLTVKLAAAAGVTHVTAVDLDLYGLRSLRDKLTAAGEGLAARVRIVRQDPSGLRDVPRERFDAATVVGLTAAPALGAAALAQIHAALVPGGLLVAGALVDEHGDAAGGARALFDDLARALEAAGELEAMRMHLRLAAEAGDRRAPAGGDQTELLRERLVAAGFRVTAEERVEVAAGAAFTLLVAVKDV